jgi:hypothetical protein
MSTLISLYSTTSNGVYSYGCLSRYGPLLQNWCLEVEHILAGPATRALLEPLGNGLMCKSEQNLRKLYRHEG